MKMNKLLVKFAMKVEQEGEGVVFLKILSKTYKIVFLLTKESWEFLSYKNMYYRYKNT